MARPATKNVTGIANGVTGVIVIRQGETEMTAETEDMTATGRGTDVMTVAGEIMVGDMEKTSPDVRMTSVGGPRAVTGTTALPVVEGEDLVKGKGHQIADTHRPQKVVSLFLNADVKLLAGMYTHQDTNNTRLCKQNRLVRIFFGD